MGKKIEKVKKEEFADGVIADFLRRSYAAVDGLWFMKVEELFGYEKAMDLDEVIWQIMPKIQARKARELRNITGNSILDFLRAIQMKLAAEGYDYSLESVGGGFMLTVNVCPWYEIIKAKGRGHIMPDIAERICKKELQGWIAEFSGAIDFENPERLCAEDRPCSSCKFIFR